VRTIIFGILVLSMFIAVIHGLMVYGLDVQIRRLALHWVVYAIVCVSVGAAAHVLRVSPEPLAEDVEEGADSVSVVPREVISTAVRHLWGEPSDTAYLPARGCGRVHDGIAG
jgi:hypothetical protein